MVEGPDLSKVHSSAVRTPVGHGSYGSGELLPLCVRDLTYNSRDRVLLDNINVTIERGVRTIIMGPNGAGKSLFLRLIHGLIKPLSGEVSWNGSAIDDAIRCRQAMVFQRPVLLRRSVGDNMDFVTRIRDRVQGGAVTVRGETRRDELLELVGLGDRIDQPARLLSGGEQQRLALARALALEPQVLLLDEPTANLDPASVLMIEEIVNDVHGGGTKIIFVTHDMAQARRLGDEVIFMHRGEIVEHASADAFFNQPKTETGRNFLAGQIIV